MERRDSFEQKVALSCTSIAILVRVHACALECVKQRTIDSLTLDPTLDALLLWLELAEATGTIKRRCDPSANVSLRQRDNRALGSEDRARAVDRFKKLGKGKRNTRVLASRRCQ